MEKCHSLDQEKLVYKCRNDVSRYKITVIHKFSTVNTHIDSLAYYITVNNNKVFYNESDTISTYFPELVSTTQNDDEYISVYLINLLCSKLTQNPSDEVKMNLILPFDHNINIISLDMFIDDYIK